MARADLKILGLSLREAAEVISEAGMSFRIVSRDGIPYVVTRDYRPERVNLTIHNHKVEHYDFG